MKNLGILIFESFFLSLTSLREARQSISYRITFFLTIINLEVVSRDLVGSTDLTKAQALDIHKSTEVVIVSKNKDLVFVAFQVVASSLENLHDG